MSFSPLTPPVTKTKPIASGNSMVAVTRTCGRFDFVKLILKRTEMPAWLRFDVDDKAKARASILLGDGESLGKIRLEPGIDFVARRTPTPLKESESNTCSILFLLAPFPGAPPAPHSRLPCSFQVEADGAVTITLPSIYFKKEREARMAALTPHSGMRR